MEVNLIESGKEEVFERLNEVINLYLTSTMKNQNIKKEEVVDNDSIIKLEYKKIE